MKLYAVKIVAPVKFGTYFVLAGSFDEAAFMAITEDNDGELESAGVDTIEVVGRCDADDANLLVSSAGMSELVKRS